MTKIRSSGNDNPYHFEHEHPESYDFDCSGAPAWTTLALLFATAALLLLISSVVLGVLYGIERNKKQEPAKTGIIKLFEKLDIQLYICQMKRILCVQVHIA